MSNIDLQLKTYPEPLRSRLSQVRALIHQIANTSSAVGHIEESLKWGQMSFATINPKSGTPIRIDGKETEGTYSLYVPCSTNLIEDFRTHHPQMFAYKGNREIRLTIETAFPKPELTLFISAALKYYI